MRLFVALNLPETERARVASASAALRSAGLPVRWVASDALHLTLKFLGEVTESAAADAARAVAAVARSHAPFPLVLRGAGAFPAGRRPAVWWIGVEPTPALLALRDAVEAAFAPLGFPTEARPFSPHVTLGRTRRDAARVPDAAQLLQRVALQTTFTVETLDLMRSHLSPRGAHYECVLAAKLAS